MLSRRIIYALFSQPGVSLGGLTHREFIPKPHWGTFVPTPNFPTPGKNPEDAHDRQGPEEETHSLSLCLSAHSVMFL